MDITWGVKAANELDWGGIIAIYLFLAGIAAGAFLTSAITDVFGKVRLEKVIRSGSLIAPVTIVIGLIMLVIDLGRPMAFWKLLFNVNFHSVMSIGVFILSVFTALAFVYAFLIWKDTTAAKLQRSSQAYSETAATIALPKSQTLRKSVAVLGCLGAIGTAGYTGFLLAAVNSIHLWSLPFLGIKGVPFLPFLFLVSAISTGLAATLIFSTKAGDTTIYKKADIVLIIIELILLLVLYLSSNSIYFSGSMAVLFWFGVVVAGLILPLLLSLYAVIKHKNMIIPACTLAVIGGLCLRYFIVYSGQLFK